MSDSARAKRPDRQFYCHPKYGNCIDTENSTQCEKERSSATDEGFHPSTPRDKLNGSISNAERHYRKARGSYRGNRGRISSRFSPAHTLNNSSENQFPTNSNINAPRAMRENANSIVSLKQQNLDKMANLTIDREQNSVSCSGLCTDSQPIVQSSQDASISNKHGGLIRLPKNVDIYQTMDEPKCPYPYRMTKRSGPQSSSRPVVVVRPSFPHSRYSESDPTNFSSENYYAMSKNITPDGNGDCAPHSQQDSWNDASKIAYQYYLKNISQLERDPHIAAPSESGFLSMHKQDSLAPVSGHRPSSIPCPNETISSTMQEIFQLDGTLTALLIPPGLCAQAIPLLQPNPPHPEPGKEWSHVQQLFLRWWTAVHRLRERLFSLFESVILADLDYCNTAHVEQGMWKSVFYTVLELLRSWISNPEATGLLQTNNTHTSTNASNEEREQLLFVLRHICLSDVIEAGDARLCNLLERIQTENRIHLAPVLADGRPPPETRSRTRRLVYLSAQKLMLFLGDLARYKEVLVGDCNFGKARSWYQKAQLLVPKNGRSYNQLAVLAVYTSRHLDAMCYYMRTLAASNPFPTASQSLAALFNEIGPRAESLMCQLRKPKIEATNPHHANFHSTDPRFQRVEIWIHPIDGQTTVLQGARRLIYLPTPTSTNTAQKSNARMGPGSTDFEVSADNDDDDEEAQAEQEEYANMSLIELSRQFGLTFIYAHGKLYTKIGMETFPEVASAALQALSGLLAQKPCPLSAERLCQLCVVSMYNVDRAMSMTTHVQTVPSSKSKTTGTKTGGSSVLGQLDQPVGPFRPGTDLDTSQIQPISRLSGSETLRSVHHDHAARFALDAFSLLCRRTAQLLQEPIPDGEPLWWLPPDASLLLSALRLWSEWMILHPEHWLPPPNHRDPTLRPCLNDWQLVAELCTQAANWLNRNPVRPEYEEANPTTSLVLRLKGVPDGENEDSEKQDRGQGHDFEAAFLFEEAYVAGFKPMLDLVPKLYRYTGNWSSDTVADFVRIEKLVLFGDFLCGIEPPVLTYDVSRAVYESAIERESSERKQDKVSETSANDRLTATSEGVPSPNEKAKFDLATVEDSEPSADIAALQRQRALLQRQLEEEARLAAWRRNAISQAASGGRRAVELEVCPIYLLPDTNCYIDWLEGIATLAQRSSNYTVLVPIVVVNELDSLARYGSTSGNSRRSGSRFIEEESEVTRAGLIQERARLAIAYLEHEFALRNSRLRALTARGSFLETIAYRTEINGGREPGQTNDDVILACCNHFCKEDSDRLRLGGLGRHLEPGLSGEQNNQPMRIVRDIVLLTSDRNLRLKALNINVPARPLRTFVNWSRLPVITSLPNLSAEPHLPTDNRKTEFPKPQPRGQWKQPLKH